MAKVKKTKSSSEPAAKEGFPTLKKMTVARNKFAEENGAKILTASKIKELIKSMGLHSGAEFTDALAKEVYLLVGKAAKRTIGNDRKTVNPKDL